MNAALKQPRMSVAQYFDFEDAADCRHEFHDGVLISMAGGSLFHGLIAANVIGELRTRLRGKDCHVVDSTVRVRIPRKPRYYYPDATIYCGEPAFDLSAPKQGALLNPSVLVEALSDSTEAFDRGDKFTDYREIESLRDYILVAQHTPRVEAYHRQDDGTWRFQPAAGLEAVARVESVGIDLPLAEVYAGVTFPPAEGGE